MILETLENFHSRQITKIAMHIWQLVPPRGVCPITAPAPGSAAPVRTLAPRQRDGTKPASPCMTWPVRLTR